MSSILYVPDPNLPLTGGGYAQPGTSAMYGSNGGVPSTTQFRTDILASPEYQQAMQNVDLWAQSQKDTQAFNNAWDQKFYEQNLAQLQSSGGGGGYSGDYGLKQAEAQAQLQKDVAAHDLANQQEFTRESLGSRGLASSGQNPVDQGELKFQYDTLLKNIDLELEGKREQVRAAQANAAAAAASAQQSRANAIADLQLKYQYGTALSAFQLQQLDAEIAGKKGDAFFSVANQLQTLYFNPSTGQYIGPGGQIVSQQQAAASVSGTVYVPPAQFTASGLVPGMTPEDQALAIAGSIFG